MVEAKAPIFMVNGYYLMGLARGADLKNNLEDYYVVIRDHTGAVVGCTTDQLTSSASAPPPRDEGQSSLVKVCCDFFLLNFSVPHHGGREH